MILYKRFVKIKHRTIRIRPVGDLQLGEKGFRKDLWERWKREALEDKDSLIIGLGDYTNRFRPSIDKKLKKVLVDDNEAHLEFDELIMKEMQGIAEELEPFKNRIIGLHTGHHKHEFLTGGNSDSYLCQLLKVKYLDFFAGIKLILARTTQSVVIDIISTHGCGGSTKIHSDLQKFTDIVNSWDANLYIRGHSTKVYCVNMPPLNKIMYSNHLKKLSIHNKQRLVVNSGGFMDGYYENVSSYVEQKNMSPAALGYAVIQVHIGNNSLEVTGTAITA